MPNIEAEAPAAAGGAFKDGFIMGFIGECIVGIEEGGKGELKGPPEERVDNQSLYR